LFVTYTLKVELKRLGAKIDGENINNSGRRKIAYTSTGTKLYCFKIGGFWDIETEMQYYDRLENGY